MAGDAVVASGLSAGLLVGVIWMVLLLLLLLVLVLVLLVVVVLVLLVAMRVVAWAGRLAAVKPAAARVSRMPQASTTHADLVRTRMACHFPS